jgi:formylglycine-generating enzyme required for sulfatase activity
MRWDVAGEVTSVAISGVSVAKSGSGHVTPERSSTYQLVAAGPGGTAERSVDIVVASQRSTEMVNPKDGLTYVWIPPGKFQMGCSLGDTECIAKERPSHTVTITKGFWLGQTEVTQAAYQRVTGKDPSHFKGAKLPVETVTWADAASYCRAVSMRLPTEAEWEYAARGKSDNGRYGELGEIAWYTGNAGRRTHEVGLKQPNAYGLYDMLGNVMEWVADWYAEYELDPQTDPSGPSAGDAHVLRGGSPIDVTPAWARASSRIKVTWKDPSEFAGFRCAGER